jgi:hypothetical protein
MADEDNAVQGNVDPAPPVLEDKPQPPPQAAIPVADLSGALVDAYQQIMRSQPQVAPQNPLDAMSDAEREALGNQAITDFAGAARQISEKASRATEQRIRQEAIPLVMTAANTIVELYKTKKQRNDPYFAKIEPLFDKLLVGVDITPLVRMNEATRNSELDMRWKMARADILEVEMKRQKPEPTLLSQGSDGGAKDSKFSEDPWIANMAKEYGFTPEQIKELEKLNA